MRLRLLKVIVQPVFVVSEDDGENPVEQIASPLTVPAAEWPAYAATGFAQAVEELRQQVEGPPPAPPAKPEHNGRVTKPARKRVSP